MKAITLSSDETEGVRNHRNAADKNMAIFNSWFNVFAILLVLLDPDALNVFDDDKGDCRLCSNFQPRT